MSMSKNIIQYRKLLRNLDNLKLQKAFEEIKTKMEERLFVYGVMPSSVNIEPTLRSNGLRFSEHLYSKLNYEKLIELTDDNSFIGSEGTLYVVFKESLELEEELGVVIDITFCTPLPEEELNTLRMLGKSHSEVRQASVSESFYCTIDNGLPF